MSVRWHKVQGVTDYQVGFGYPCARKFGSTLMGPGYKKQDCCTYNHPDKHGHVHLCTEEGVGRFLFCCFSQEGVKRVVLRLEKIGYINAEAVAVILNLPEVLALPVSLTAIEKRILRSSLKWKRDMDFVVTKKK